MLGIKSAKPAFKFAALDLMSPGKAGCDEVSLFQFGAVFGYGNRGVEIEVGIYRRIERYFRRIQIKAVSSIPRFRISSVVRLDE